MTRRRDLIGFGRRGWRSGSNHGDGEKSRQKHIAKLFLGKITFICQAAKFFRIFKIFFLSILSIESNFSIPPALNFFFQHCQRFFSRTTSKYPRDLYSYAPNVLNEVRNAMVRGKTKHLMPIFFRQRISYIYRS